MNCHLSGVIIHVQTWGILFEIMGRYCNTSRLHCAVRNVVPFYCLEVKGMLFREKYYDMVHLDAF